MLTIYFDLDGVLCDFDRQCSQLNCWKPNGRPNWDLMDEIGPSFWESMNPINTGMELINLCKDYVDNTPNIQLGILSAIHLKNGKIGKINWIHNHLPYIDSNNIVILNNGNLKSQYANTNSLLVDDNKDNVYNFSLNGGLSVQFDKHKNPLFLLARIVALTDPYK